MHLRQLAHTFIWPLIWPLTWWFLIWDKCSSYQCWVTFMWEEYMIWSICGIDGISIDILDEEWRGICEQLIWWMIYWRLPQCEKIIITQYFRTNHFLSSHSPVIPLLPHHFKAIFAHFYLFTTVIYHCWTSPITPGITLVYSSPW
jgi:hypothetical protein